MGLTFETIDGKSRGFKILTTTLAAVSMAGFISFVISYIKGHYLLGTSNILPWGMPIIITIYLIGLSAGSLILSSLTYVFRKEVYRPIARLAVFLAIILIFGAMIGIALDLGRPEKSWRLFMFFVLNNMRSMFAINGILYGGYFLIGLVYLGFIFGEKSKWTKVMGIIAIGWAALVHMGTGAIFGFIATRPIFFSPIKPFEFLVVNSSAFDFGEKKVAYFNSIGKSLMIKKTIFTDSPEEYGNKSYDKVIVTKNPSGFLKVLDSLQ